MIVDLIKRLTKISGIKISCTLVLNIAINVTNGTNCMASWQHPCRISSLKFQRTKQIC